MNILDIILTQPNVTVDLLAASPNNTDPALFQKISWPGYTSAIAQVVIVCNQQPSGVIYTVRPAWSVPTGNWPLTAWAISFQGNALAIGSFNNGTTINGGLFSPLITSIVAPILF